MGKGTDLCVYLSTSSAICQLRTSARGQLSTSRRESTLDRLTDIRDIQTSTSDISSNQRLNLSISKLLQSSLTLCLSLVGVQGSRGPTTLLHHLHNNIGSTLLIDENDLYFVSFK
jgi:hypothetical protein